MWLTHRKATIGGGLVLALSSCTVTDRAITGPEATILPAEQVVARGLAMAMRDEPIRLAVRNAMRASTLTEHKLVLAEFLLSAEGAQLLDGAAAASRQTRAAFLATVRKLPEMDFYVPARSQRLTWNGSAQLLVGASAGADFRRVASFDPDGNPSVVSSAQRADVGAFFLLQPAETKGRRIRPQAATPGDVIQDAGDGELSGRIIRTLPNGRIITIELADLIGKPDEHVREHVLAGDPSCEQPYDPRDRTLGLTESAAEGGTCYGGSYFPGDTTVLRDFIVVSVCDHLDCGQGNEFEWLTTYLRSGVEIEERRIRWEGVGSTVQFADINLPLIFRRPLQANEQVRVHIYETDPWILAGDDQFGPDALVGWTDRIRWYQAGDVRCGNPPYSCPGPNGWVTWREIQQRFYWTI